MKTPQRLTRGAVAGASAVLTVAVVTSMFALMGPAASAHGPIGEFQVQPSNVVGPLTVSFRARLIYSNDTDPVTSGANVTVQGSGPGGSVGPVSMGYTGSDGYYTATVSFPAGGTWSITYRSQNPAAQFGASQVVPSPAPAPTEPPPTARPPSSQAPPSTEAVTTTTETTIVESTTTTAAASTTTSRPPETEEVAALPASSTSDATYDVALVLLGAVVAVAVLGLTSAIAWRGSGR